MQLTLHTCFVPFFQTIKAVKFLIFFLHTGKIFFHFIHVIARKFNILSDCDSLDLLSWVADFQKKCYHVQGYVFIPLLNFTPHAFVI